MQNLKDRMEQQRFQEERLAAGIGAVTIGAIALGAAISIASEGSTLGGATAAALATVCATGAVLMGWIGYCNFKQTH